MSAEDSQPLLSRERVGNVEVIRFSISKVLQPEVAIRLGSLLDIEARKDDTRRVVLNFGNVEYLSSTAIGKFIKFGAQMKKKGGEVKLCSIGANIKDIFDIMKLDRVFDIHKSEHDAVEAFE